MTLLWVTEHSLCDAKTNCAKKNYLTFTGTQTRKKPTRKHPYFPMKPTVTAILRDASVKMHHGMLFDCRLICIEKVDAKC